MSIHRLFLRCLAVAALSPAPGDTDLITMAGESVFDTRLDPLEFTADEKEIPTIVVYTDDDTAEIWNRSSNSGPYHRTIDLRVELAMGSFSTVVQDEEKYVAYGVPSIDAELEAKLDVFEQQALWALRSWPDRQATIAFRDYIVRLERIESHAHRDESGNNKLALRRVHMRCVVNDDCPPVWTAGPEGLGLQRKLTEGDFPVPGWLQPMFAAMQSSPSMSAAINRIAGTGSADIRLPLLKRIGVKVDCISPADLNLLEKLNRTRGPDGRLEYTAVWNLPNAND
jgi:hypothetical protein